MKLLLLIIYKDEAHILGSCLESVAHIVDGIIGYDDGSMDHSSQILRRFGGKVLPRQTSFPPFALGGEPLIRQELLNAGRIDGGTHFLCLDADELIGANFDSDTRKEIDNLIPGQKLHLPWITLWKSPRYYCAPTSKLPPTYKDFIFFDEPSLNYTSGPLHTTPRTPSSSNSIDPILLPVDQGVVLHTQFLFWKRSQIKQAWYRCSELIGSSKPIRQINLTYRDTIASEEMHLKEVDSEWINSRFSLSTDNSDDTWQSLELLHWFEIYGIEHFEYLDIWHVDCLLDEFRKRTGRNPSRPVYPSRARLAFGHVRGLAKANFPTRKKWRDQ